MATTAQQIRSWTGPTILSFGFRPFFLLAGIWAALAMVLWVLFLSGGIALPTAFDAVSWHAHEMLFGYLGAVFAGFLMTAVPNWTGRLPVVGWPLACLVLTWLAGRLAVALSGYDPVAAAVVDMAFPLSLALVIGREVIAGRNIRNLPVLALLAGFVAGNLLYHLSAFQGEFAAEGLGFRLGISVAVMMIALIGGRIVPSFTGNWLAKRGSRYRPVPFSPVDRAILLYSLAALMLWIALPVHQATAIALVPAGIAHLWRLSRWHGHRTVAEPLVWILHVGYLFVPLGFLSTAAAAVGWLTPGTALHVWMAGAIGVMTMAVMTRASLGHGGRPMTATPMTQVAYLLLLGAVVARFAYGLGANSDLLLHLSAGFWIAAFATFVISYWTVLVRPRRSEP
ncbi:NnrS family protein [Minwuia sp.]|uniref:NnrS family protein n=1 Tax=Minwuia sp. TaxID=2493630 RepID=UPI003A92A072